MRRLQKTKSLTPASLPSWHDIIKLLTLLDIIDHWSLNQESRPTTHHPQNHTSKQFHSHWPSLYLTTTAGLSRCGPSCQILDIISTLNPAVSGNSMTPRSSSGCFLVECESENQKEGSRRVLKKFYLWIRFGQLWLPPFRCQENQQLDFAAEILHQNLSLK